MSYTIVSKFLCTKCSNDLEKVKLAYGLIICPKCNTKHMVYQTPITEHGKPINTDIRIELRRFEATCGTIPLPKMGT